MVYQASNNCAEGLGLLCGSNGVEWQGLAVILRQRREENDLSLETPTRPEWRLFLFSN